MKPDTERTKRYHSKLHQRKAYLHVHVAKDIRGKLKSKRRAVSVRKGDKVRVLRGFARGKEGKVVRVTYLRPKVYLEGIIHRTARGREVPYALEPSNLLLIELTPSPDRKDILGAVAPSEKPKSKAVVPAAGESHG